MIADGVAPRWVLLVEEEPPLRLLMADMIYDLGFQIVAEAGDIEQAMALAKSEDFDLAILDARLDGHWVFPVADILIARKRPFAFATGHLASDLPDRYRCWPVLQKPVQFEALRQALADLLAAPRPA
jgi:CheY-like chemotaxis protein